MRADNIDISELIGSPRDAVDGKRAFGEPYEKDGVVVIPAASVRGGAGGGGGSDAHGGAGSGTGFGLSARPAGAYVIKDGDVRWQPAIDVTRIVIGFQILAMILVLARRSVLKARARS